MPSMSYCAFQNTDAELAQCEEMLEALQNTDRAPLSARELAAAKSLIARACKMISGLAEVARGTGFAESQVGYDEDDDDLEMIVNCGDALLERINLAAEDYDGE